MAFFAITLTILTVALPAFGLPKDKTPKDAFHRYDPQALKGFDYYADIFTGQRCTGDGHVGNPFVEFSCHRKCYPVDSGQSIRLSITNPEGEDWMDVDYSKIYMTGPMANLYRANDCTGPKIGEARIPAGNNTACLSWHEEAQSIQLIYLEDCGKEEFVTKGVESDYRMPWFVNWNDPDGFDDFVPGNRHTPTSLPE